MRNLLKCKVTICLLAGWVLLSAAGYYHRNDIYRDYPLDVKKTPYFVLVLQGIHDGIYPWSEPEEVAAEEWTTDEMPTQPMQNVPVDGNTETEKKAVTETEIVRETEVTTEMESVTETEEIFDTEEEKNPTETEEPPLRKFIQVEDDYFDDAVFIGDSRTVGLHDYSGLDGADFFATVGMNVYDLWKEEFCEVGGRKMLLEDALKVRKYKKIYFQIGINEMGRGTLDAFMGKYTEAVQKFQELQPDAVIYVQAIMKVTKKKSDSDPIFNNPNITQRNERIRALADGRRIFYIDENEAVCGEDGALNPELTFDNLHLYGSEYYLWVDFLKTKGVEIF